MTSKYESIFNYSEGEAIGRVVEVDSAEVIVHIEDESHLKTFQVNHLVKLDSSKPGHHLIGLVSRITRKPSWNEESDEAGEARLVRDERNLMRVSLIGTLVDREGDDRNKFQRTLETVPDIDALCFAVEDKRLTAFMQAISHIDKEEAPLEIGRYTLDDEAVAYLNGNKLFQRHAIIVGTTGSGKSWATARLLDQMSDLPHASAILFDVHGEYESLKGTAFRHFRVAGPSDLGTDSDLDDGVLYLPYWLLGYEALVSLFVDRSDQNAPNQATIMNQTITEQKLEYLTAQRNAANVSNNSEDAQLFTEIIGNFTIDSPVPFEIDEVLKKLTCRNEEDVPGARPNTTKAGEYKGKLSRLIERLSVKRSDRRLGFMFQAPDICLEMSWLDDMIHQLIGDSGSQVDQSGGIKIIDFSAVPSDLLPTMVSLLARLVFTVMQWMNRDDRHPVALFCDEAHLYLPVQQGGSDDFGASSNIFERIAKEGRKYGVGLVIISQRPSEVNRTVLSQCNNIVAMCLTNGEDQTVISRLLPDSLLGYRSLLPVLDVGEALIVGDACLLPARVKIKEPKCKPISATVDFWDLWRTGPGKPDTRGGVRAWRRQVQESG